MSIYKNQSLLTLSLDTSADLTNTSDHRILYKKPDGTKGHFTASTSTTKIEYQTANGDLDQSGEWELQAYYVLSGKKAYGKIVKLKVEESL
jgi:hypothetical protein